MGPPSPSLSRSASRPLPSPLSFTGVSRSCCRRNAVPRENLARQGDIGLRAFAFAIEFHGGGGRAPRPRGPVGGRKHRGFHFFSPRRPPIRRHPLRAGVC